uniref:MADS-box domain-containing protein n=1 Tax=Schistocephalus solidus TaxID=70667 RepID=A0A0X3PEZ6_SCHSO
MGRRKIEIKPILDPKTLLVTFAKRKVGLFNKAYELSVLCKCKVAVLVVTSRDRVHKFASTKFDEILEEANRSKHPPDITDGRQVLKKQRRRVSHQLISESTPNHSVSGTEDQTDNSSPQTPDSLAPHLDRGGSIFQGSLKSPTSNALDKAVDHFAQSTTPLSAKDVTDSVAPMSYVMANGSEIPFLGIAQSAHRLAVQPVSSSNISSSPCVQRAASEPCPLAVTPIASKLHPDYEFPSPTPLPSSAPASTQHPAVELSMPPPLPLVTTPFVHGSLLSLVPSPPPTSQPLEIVADSPRFLGPTVTTTDDSHPEPTVAEARQGIEPESILNTTASTEENQPKDPKPSRSVGSRTLPAITANSLEVQNFVRPFETEAPDTFFSRTKGILPKVPLLREKLLVSDETLKTPVVFTNKTDIWPCLVVNTGGGSMDAAELADSSSVCAFLELPNKSASTSATSVVKKQAEEEGEKGCDGEEGEEEPTSEPVPSRKRITYTFDERLIGESGSPSPPKLQLLREERIT